MQDLNIVKTLVEFERHVEGLAHSIPETKANDIHMRLQRYIIGVPEHISQLLWKVSHTVVCYYDHH